MSDNKNDKLQKLRNKFADSFEYNEETKVLRIKDGVKNFYNIGILPYFHFEDMEEVILPTSLERISARSFQYAKSLKKVSFAKDGKQPQLKEIGFDAFYGCENLEEFEFCDSITTLELGAFYKCKKLKTFAFSSKNEPKTIGECAFAWCNSLVSVKNLEGVTSIGNEAFSNCNSLQRFTIPESCTDIHSATFTRCDNLEDLTLSSNLKSVGNSIVSMCPKIKFDMDNNSKDNTVYIHNGYLMQKKENGDIVLVAVASDATPTTPPETTIIGENAFSYCTIPKLTLNDGLKKIEYYAFSNTNGLKSLIIPDSVENIDNICFSHSSIEELTLGENSSLQFGSLANSSIKRVIVPQNCKNYYLSPDGAVIEKSNSQLIFCNENSFPDDVKMFAVDIHFSTNEVEYHLPNNIRYLNREFMYECPNLKKVYIGSKMCASLSGDAFKGCPNLTDIVIAPENQRYKSIDGCVYESNEKGQFINLVFATTHSRIKDGTKSINNCFISGDTSIERIVPVGYDKTPQPNTVYIPNSVENFRFQTLKNLPNLKEIIAPENLKNVDSFSIVDCPNIEKIYFPANTNTYKGKYMRFMYDDVKNLKQYTAPLLPEFFCQTILHTNAELFALTQIDGKNIEVKLPKDIHECLDKDMVLFKKEDGKIAIARVDTSSPQTGYLKIIDFEDALENATKTNLYTNIFEHDLFKLIPFNNAKANNIAKFLPVPYVIKNLPKEEIISYFKNALASNRGSKNTGSDVLNSWQDIMTKCRFLGEEKTISEMPDEYKIAVFKVAESLGMFVDDDKRYLPLPTICKWLNENILQKFNKETIKRVFSDFDTYNHPYNKDFAILFINCIEQYAKSENYKRNVDKKFQRTDKYQPMFLDFVLADDLGSVQNAMSNFHNNFDKLLEKFDKKIVSSNMRRHTNANYIQMHDVEFYFANVSNFDVSKFLATQNDEMHSTRNELIKDFANTLAQNSQHTQLEFETLLKWYMLGMKNYASARVKQARGEIPHLTLDISPMDTICTTDELADAQIRYHYLDKRSPTTSILGELSNCCQSIGRAGESCVKYGMVKPNSGFLEFRDASGKFMGQGWVWYNPENKQVTIDNIEIPTTLLGRMDDLEMQFKKLLENITKGIIKGMGTKNVNRITIGLGYNDLSHLLKNEKLYKKYTPNEIIEENETLTESEIAILKGGTPRDFTLSEIQKDNDSNIKIVYSDAREGIGQILLWENPKEKTKEK